MPLKNEIRHKLLFKIMYPSLVWIIVLIGVMYFLNILMWHLDSPIEILSYLGGLSVLPFLFLLIATFTLHFRTYHRIPLYYAMTVEVLNWLDYYVEFGWDEDFRFCFMMALTGIALSVMAVSYCRNRRQSRERESENVISIRQRSHDQFYYKLELSLLKVIPMVIAFMYVTDTVLYCLNVSMAVPSFFIGTSLLPLLFILLSSFVFQFCIWHRIFIYYIMIINLLNYASLFPCFQFDDTVAVAIQLFLAGVSLFLIFFFYDKSHQKTASTTA